MSFSLYSFDTESVNDADGYTVGIQAIFNNQHPIANVWLIAALPADLLWCLPRIVTILSEEHYFPALVKVPIVLFPLVLLIPFLAELGWVVETFTALVDFHHFALSQFCELLPGRCCTARRYRKALRSSKHCHHMRDYLADPAHQGATSAPPAGSGPAALSPGIPRAASAAARNRSTAASGTGAAAHLSAAR